jgi:methyltransferase (TIGR00027 family)
MIPGEPSRTALAAATHRAVHQLLEGGRVFADRLAVPILATDPTVLTAAAMTQPQRRPMRFFIAARHRIAEDAVAAAVASGLTQLVVLGAGLDTQAYRAAHGDALAIFEVDHPATQAWKQRRLADAGIAIPPPLRFVAVNFETDSLAERLVAAGFDPDRRAFFAWLGVVPYLTEAAIFATLSYIAGLPGGAEVVFDYANPLHALPLALQPAFVLRATQVAMLGEAWISYFDTETLSQRLRSIGFTGLEDFSPADLASRFGAGGTTLLRDKGGHVMRAWT